MVALGPISPLLSCPRGLSCCSSPSCSSPATPPCAEQSPGRCIRCFLVPLHQEPGSERSSSRIRGAHLASDGPSPQLPTGAVVLLHAPLCSCPATPPRAGESPGSCPRPRPVPLHQEPGSERSSSRTRQRGAPGLRRPQPPAAHGGCSAAPRPSLFVPSDATARGKGPGSCLRPPPVPLHQEPGSERSSSRTTGAHLAPDGPHLQRPRGLSCCSSPRCSSPATPPCAEQS